MDVLEFARLARLIETSRSPVVNTGIDEEYRLSVAEVLVLGQLVPEPRQTVNEIARLTGIAQSNVSRLVGNLHRAGWLESRPASLDRRLTVISVRERRQRHMLERLEAPAEGRLRAWAADLDDATRGELQMRLREFLGTVSP